MMAGSNRRAARPLKRRVGTRRPRKTLLVFCEGERTEPEYLEALKREPSVRDMASVDLRVEFVPNGSKPRTLVSKAADAHRRAVEGEDEIDEFWCVFDVEWPDNHPGLKEAIQQARQVGINLAVSNPCFELWLILHFQDYGSWLDNDGARRLRRRLDGSPDKGISPTKYLPLVGDAARRAADLDRRHDRNGIEVPDNNPSSGMHRLIAAVKP